MRLILLFLFCALSAWGQFTDFYVDTAVGSSNIYAGSTSSTTPTYISISGNWNGSTTFTPTDGSTPASTVSAGMWGAISFTSVPSNAVYIAQIDTVNAGVNGTVVLSANSKGGTAPGSITGDATLVVGGVWKGPNTNNTWAGTSRTIVFPFAFVGPQMTNESTITIPCINFKYGIYPTTNAIAHSINGPIRFSGYGTSPRDRSARATIDGGTVYPGYALLNISGTFIDVSDFVFSNNGNSGSTFDLFTGVSSTKLYRCTAHDSRRYGFNAAAVASECEAYSCNTGNAAAGAGFLGVVILNRCMSYSNTTANSSGFSMAVGSSTAINCISAFNSRSGFVAGFGGTASLINCSAYSNALNGIEFNTGSTFGFFVENCSMVNNGKAGITNNSSTTALKLGSVDNIGLGAGTMTNSGGGLWTGMGWDTNTFVLYPGNTTPWKSPDTGNFSISLMQSKSVGRGFYTESSGLTGTLGYPDIGAAQSASTNSSGGGSWTFSQ